MGAGTDLQLAIFSIPKGSIHITVAKLVRGETNNH